MNILFITPSVPSRLHRNRSFELIKALVKNHKVHVLSLDPSNGRYQFPDELKSAVSSYEIIRKSKWRSIADCAAMLFSSIPLEVAYCHSRKMQESVNKIVSDKKIDLIYVKRLRSAQFVNKLKTKVPMLLDTTDAMSLFYKRACRSIQWYKKPLYFEEYLKYLWYEKKLTKIFKTWIVCSQVDADYLRGRLQGITFEIVYNIVGLDYFKPLENKEAKAGQPNLVITGLMDKFVNIEAVEFFVIKAYPYILHDFPDAMLYIVGPNPVAKIRKFGSKNITVTGFVDDIRDYIGKADVVLCPVKTGTGTRFKIQQAMAMEKAVVSTKAGLEGLDVIDGKHLLVADDAKMFADKVILLLKNKQFRNTLGENGRKLVISKYSDQSVGKKINDIMLNS